MNEELISIVITTYRRPFLITRAVENCLKQTYKKTEIIVVDDNGKNTPDQLATRSAIENYITADKIIYHSLEKNMGACFARNSGAEKSKGKFLAFFDDDEWTETKLELQYKAIVSSDENTGMVLCGQKLVDAKSGRVYSKRKFDRLSTEGYQLLLNSAYAFATPNPLIRKNAFIKIGGFKYALKSSQDLEFGIRMTKNYKVFAIDDYCLNSLVHSGSRISTNHAGKIQGFKYILSTYDKDLINKGKIHYWQRILMHSYFGKLKSEAVQSSIELKKLNAFTIKYRCFFIGLFILPIRIILNLYLRLNKSLY